MTPFHPTCPPTAPLPSPSLRSQGTHLLMAPGSRVGSEHLGKWVGLRLTGTQSRGNLISARGERTGKGAEYGALSTPLPPKHHSLAPCSNRKALTSSSILAAGSAPSSSGGGWVCAWQECGIPHPIALCCQPLARFRPQAPPLQRAAPTWAALGLARCEPAA